jgi:sugar phosphate isomerase/epimerase
VTDAPALPAAPVSLGARTDCVEFLQPDERIPEIARLGFDFVEAVTTLAAVDREVPRYQRSAERQGLRIRSLSVGDFVRVPALSGAELAEAEARLRDVPGLAASVGADVMLLPVRIPARDEQGAADAYRAIIAAVLDDARQRQVTLALEFVARTTPAAAAALVESVDDPAVRLYFDIGNCLFCGRNPLAELPRFLPLTACIHVKGGPRTVLAAMPLGAVSALLANAGYRGRLCLELHEPTGRDDVLDAVAVLQMTNFWRPRQGE